MQIHILQLPKWKTEKSAGTEKDRWLYLFREGKNVDTENLPEILNTKEMRQVMKVMQGFSENQRNYLLYQSRLEAMYEYNTWQHEMETSRKRAEQAEKEKRQAEKEKRRAEKEKQQAEKENSRLKKEKQQAEEKLRQMEALLRKKGIEIPK
ncbi:MAG: PD-(D/E)XK nuclease family transposase [Desulfobacterales bacterium]